MAFPYLTDIVNALLDTRWELPIPTFGVLVAVAILLAARVTRSEVRRQELLGNLPPSTDTAVLDLAAVSAIAGIIGARVFYIFDHSSAFVADPLAMIFSRGGFSIYGGICFGLAAGVLFLNVRRVPIRPMLDAAAPSMMLGYAVGRVGCQLAGDGDWGIEANMALKPGWLPDWLWAQAYEGNIVGVVIAAPGVYPTPIYESAAALILFGVLWAFRLQRNRAGFLFSLYLLLTGFERLLIEKIRVNVKHDVLGAYLTQAELVSLLLILAGFIGVLISLQGRRLWAKALFSAGVLAALSACVPI
jgi:phosphatidylglycerol:prolipoprotein diacylglycerol transferase